MRVAICGGGLSGLTLYRLLAHQAAVSKVVVFERDESAFSRDQGTCLDLGRPAQKILAMTTSTNMTAIPS